MFRTLCTRAFNLLLIYGRILGFVSAYCIRLWFGVATPHFVHGYAKCFVRSKWRSVVQSATLNGGWVLTYPLEMDGCTVNMLLFVLLFQIGG